MRKLGTKHVESGKACANAVTALCSRLILLFVAFAVFFPTQGRAQVSCTPDAGYTTCRAYTYTGADQGVTVPGNITSIKVKAWGAGAGGSVLAASNIGAPGGSGGYVEGVLAVTPGSQYVVMTGRGGGADGTAGSSANCSAAYGFGGACAPARGGSYSDGGGGGGLAGLFTGSTPVTATDNARAVFVAGGGGAGEGTNACGNTSAAGGAGGNSFAGAMSTMQGINGAFSGGANPTGGGGGYHGGDGTTRLRNGTCVASANGGSNFIAGAGTSATVNLPGNEAPSVPNFTVKNPPSTTEPQYIAGVGVGQLALAVVGGNGLVVLQWADPILSVSKTATPNPFVSGQPASYAVTIQNTGAASTFGNITISDTLPTGVTLASASGANWSCSGTTALTCTFTGVLAIGDSTTLTLNVDVSNSAVNGNNAATASGGADPTCPAAAHCTGSVTVPINTTYVCSPSTIFVTQNTPAQLFSETYGSGSATFNPIGPVSAWNYNSAGYRAADNYIYAVSAALDAAHPVNHLLRIDPATGAVADVGAITGLPASGVNSGAFDASDNYYVGFNTATSIYRINLTTRVATAIALTPSAQLQIADWTFASGFLWGVTNNAQSITRVNPTTGAIARYAVTILPVASGYGAAWTFGNGNLGFGNNDTGTIYQVRVATPAGTPTFTLVSSSPGPLPSVANDGTSCISAPADLGITKTGPASSSAGGALSWTLTVTNNGAGASSGFTVVDTVPAGVTGIASPTSGCTVAGSTVTCVEGALAVGGTFNITINGNAPNPFTAAITNTATVTGNESDSVAANNTATETVTPLNPTLTVTKTATPASFVIGQSASYAITVQNTGNGPTTASFTITDTLPAGITFASAAGTSWSCTGTTTLTCTFTGTLAAGGSTVLTLNVNVTATALNGDNSATARGGGDPTCPATGATAAHCTDNVTVPIATSYICSPSTIFVGQGQPTQLNAETYGSGGATFVPIGPVAPWTYNSIAYRASDNYIYANSVALDAAHPINHLLRIDPSNGGVADLGAITGVLASGTNNGTFDTSGNYYIGSGSDTAIYRVNLTTRAATAINLTPSQTLGVSDFAFLSGYLWGLTTSASPPTMTRINPTNGAIARFAIPAMPIVTATGAAWTFGNGNLGFSDNTTGNVYQIRVTNPTGTPTFALVSQSPGPPSGNNDGTSCVTPPIDLAIAKTGPASAAAGGAISWTLTVTNNGPATSSGYTVVDTVPAGVTNIASPTPGCTVAGNTVTCVGGQLAVGATFSFTVTGNAPVPFSTAITNTATVTGNETDPVAGNNTATQTVNPPPATPPTLIKYFNTDPPTTPPPARPPPMRRGGTALLTFAIDNTQSSSGSQSGLGFTDTLPSGLVLAAGSSPPSALVGTNTCGGSVSAAAGAAAITLAGGSVAAHAQCTFTVRVTTAP